MEDYDTKRSHNDQSGLIAVSVAIALILEGYWFTQSLNDKDKLINQLQMENSTLQGELKGYSQGRH